MRPESLHAFITLLEQADELRRVEVTVDPYLELAAIVNRVCKGAGQKRALLFENVKGSSLPVAANLFGSRQRVAWALGTTDLESLADRLRQDLLATGLSGSGAALIELLSAAQWQPRQEQGSACCDAEWENGILALPQIQAWPDDGGAYLTLGQVFSRAPDSPIQNCGMYRLQIFAAERGALHLRPGSGCGTHLQAWAECGQPMPVAITLGGPPALTWAAGLPLPEAITETTFAGYLTGAPLAMMACRNSDLQVPATSEIVIEGVLLPGEVAEEGPFGNHTGSYVTAAPAAVLKVNGVSARRDAVCPWTLVGPPPMEDLFMAAAAERLLLPLLQHDHPWVTDLHMPLPGIFHRAAMVTIAADETRSAAELCEALWQSQLLRNARLLVLLDDEVDPQDPAQIYWHAVNCDLQRQGVLLEEGRLVVDGRRGRDRTPLQGDPATLAKVASRWKDYRLG